MRLCKRGLWPGRGSRDRVRVYVTNEKYKSRNWSQEIYEISKVLKPQVGYGVYEYLIKNDPDKMRYKNEELLKVTEVENEAEKIETYEVSKIIEEKIKNGRPAFLVSWKRYRKKSDRTIEFEDDLNDYVPKMVKLFKQRNHISFTEIKSGNQKGQFKVVKKNVNLRKN